MNTNFEITAANEVEELNQNEIECVNGGFGPLLIGAVVGIRVGVAAAQVYQAHQENKRRRR